MTTDYAEILKKHPKYMSLDRMRIICHISKKTARLLLQNGLIPYKKNRKKTRSYKIKTVDVIKHLKQRDVIPEKYMLPSGAYVKPISDDKEIVCHIVNVEEARRIYEMRFSQCPDLLSIQQTAALAEATIKTVSRWIRGKHLKAFKKAGVYYVPKLALMEYLVSPLYRGSPSGKRKYAENYFGVSLTE